MVLRFGELKTKSRTYFCQTERHYLTHGSGQHVFLAEFAIVEGSNQSTEQRTKCNQNRNDTIDFVAS